MFFGRVDVQDKVRRLRSNPDEYNLQAVEQKRQMLASMLTKLKQLQEAAGILPRGPGCDHFDDNEEEFDDIAGSVSAAQSDATNQNTRDRDMLMVEWEVLTLPSNGNVSPDTIKVEIYHRKQQARRQINRLRDIIADLSFQYSHVIRGSIRKTVRANAQKRIKTLHNDLVRHARIYTRCRSRLLALKCDEQWLKEFRVLKRSDLQASTAILQPNIPGSSSLHLSWIWQTGRWHLFNEGPDADADAGADADATTLLECSSQFIFTILSNKPIVKRVHWLRARALKNRWHEEVVLVTYEMQWTVRYFLHKSTTWSEAIADPSIFSGAKAYAFRQANMWKKLADVADNVFKSMPSRYLSPICIM